MPECDECGAHVSDDFHRVFSEPGTGELRACPADDCKTVAIEYGSDFADKDDDGD